MSTTVDQRVVEMRFDNAQFERGVSATMSTLDKFKEKLNFKGANKGFEALGAAAKKVDLSPLSNAADTVAVKFSHMQMTVQHQLNRMVDSAIAAGKRMASALTIDPIKTGLSEYETKINAVQVIKANTRSLYDGDEEKQMADITAALDELNEYADRTIYNFTQMTDNVGKFVAQGLDVKEATKAVQGLANLAGASGASATDMARATYQMSQALGGVIRKMDWNSLRTANMATTELKTVLTDIAKVRGIDIDGMIKKKGIFEDTLEEGWLTGDLFTEAMNIYSDVYSEAELKAKGFTEEQIKNFKDLAKTAAEATTEVKTMSQLWDVLKETAQSGWTQTWELIIGDFNSAKKMWSKLQNYLSDIINGWSDMRNSILGGALNMGSTWSKISDKFNNSDLGKMLSAGGKQAENFLRNNGLASLIGTVGKVTDKVSTATKKLEDFQDIVNKVWRGDYKNSDTGRFDKLDAEGWDHRVIQDLVNKGYQYKLTVEDVEASHKKFGLTMEKTTSETEEAAESTNMLTEVMSSLTDKQLEQIGLTKGEIKVYRDLEKAAKDSGRSIEEVVAAMSTKDGRTMLINSLKNAGSGLIGVFKAIKEAWTDIFPAPSVVKIYMMIEAVEKFSEKLRLTDKKTGELNETGKKIQRTFKGIFAIIDITTTVLGGGLKIVLKAVAGLLGAFNLDILDVTAAIGDFAVRIRDMMDKVLDFPKIFGEIGRVLKGSGVAIYNWIQTLKDSENLPRDILVGLGKGISKVASYIGSIFKKLGSAVADALGIDLSGFIGKLGKFGKSIREWFAGLKDSDNIPRDIILGLANGIKNGAIMVWEAGKSLADGLVEKVKKLLGIHSPSKVFEGIGVNIIEGLINGIKSLASKVWSAVQDVFTGAIQFVKDHDVVDKIKGFIRGAFSKVVDFIRNFDIGDAIALTMGVSLISAFKKFTDTIAKLAGPIEGLSNLLNSASGVLDSVKGVFNGLADGIKNYVKAVKWEKMSIAIRNFAIAIAILVGSLIALTFIPEDKLKSSLHILGVLMVTMAGFVLVMSLAKKLSGSSLTAAALSASMLGIGLALLSLAAVVKIIGGMSPADAQQGLKGLLGLLAGLSVFVAVFGSFVKGKTAKNFKQAGKTIFKIGVALLVLVGVMKILAGMSNREMTRAAVGMIALMFVVKSLMQSSTIAGRNSNKAGSALLKIAGALAAMVIVAKIIAGMEWSDMGKAAVGMAGMIAVIAAMSLITKVGGKDTAKLGSTLMGMAAAMLILAGVAKILATMTWAEMGKAFVGLTAFAGIIALLVYSCNLAGDKAPKLALTLLAMSIAIGILAAIAVMLGIIDEKHLAKGVAVVAALGAIVAGMLIATRKSSSSAAKNLTQLTIAIAVMVAAIAVLSFIDGKDLAAATAAMGSIMGVFALVIYACKSLKKVKMGPLIILTVAIGVIAASIFLLAKLLPDTTAALSAAGAISLILLAMSGSMFLVSKMGAVTKNALPSIMTVMAVVGVLASILYLLGPLEVTSTLTSALALSTLLIALAGAMKVLSTIHTMSKTAVVAMGVLAIVVGILAGTLVKIQGLPVESTIANTISMSVLLVAMAAVCRIISTIPLAGALEGIVGFAAFIRSMTIILGVLGALYQLDVVKKLVADGGQFLADIGLAIGNFVGSIVKGIAISVVSALPVIADTLSLFMLKLQPFLYGLRSVSLDTLAGAGMLGLIMVEFMAISFGSIFASIAGLGLPVFAVELSAFMTALDPFLQGAKNIKPEMLEGVSTLSGIILALSAAGLIDGISRIFNLGEGSLSRFGRQLPALGEGLSGFAEHVRSIEPATLMKVNIAAQAVSTLAKAAAEIPNSGGLLGLILGNNDLGPFGTQIGVLGEGLKAFMDALPDGLTDGDVTMVSNAASAVKLLAEAAAEIPNSGGILGDILGNNDLSGFATQFPTLATGLRDFLSNLPETFGDAELTKVSLAADAVKTLADAAKNIPNSGGILGDILGNNDLAGFADQFPKLASGLKGFKENLPEDFGEATATAIAFAAAAVKDMALAAKEIPNTGGILGDIFGNNDLGGFSEQFPKLGDGLKGFVTNLGTFTEAQVTAVQNAVLALNAITALSGGEVFVKQNLGELIDCLEDIGTEIKDFAASMQSVSVPSVNKAVDCMTKVANAAKDLASINADHAKNFKSAVKDLSEVGVSGFVETFTGMDSITSVQDAAKKLVDYIISAFKLKNDALKIATITLGKAACGAMKTQDMWELYVSAGEYVVKGFSAGIGADTWRAEAKARAMATAAINAAKKALDEHSPSRVFMKIGRYVPEGFAIGIDKFRNVAEFAAQSMSEGTIDSVRNSLSHLSSIMSLDLENIQPTIRPVLDLSEVQARASALDGMLSTRLSAGVMANIRAIDARMNQRRQNGNNHEIISAIKGLSKDLNKAGNTTYSINGITYSHGDEVETAVRTIVRAVKIGGRA